MIGFIMKRNLSTVSLTMTAIVVVSILLIGPALTSSSRSALAASDTSQQCKNSADKISSKAETHQSNNVCGIELSRDSPILNLFGKKINDQVPMEFPYQPASASSGSQVLMLAEFTLVQSEVDKVNQYLRDHHWTVTAIHNHWFNESPRLIFLHSQKQDNLDNILSEVKGALQQTNCGCT
jgi:Domain of Unknown Function (DUF1259)